VDYPLVAVAARLRLHVGQIGSGVGLRVALAPQLLAAGDRRQETPLLRRTAERDDGRPEQRFADVSEPAGRPGAGVLLEEEELRHERQPAPAVRLRPADAGPTGGPQHAIPGTPFVDQHMLVAGAPAAAQRRELAGEMVSQPACDLGPEGFVAVSETQVHAR